jgi:hypothetical protein
LKALLSILNVRVMEPHHLYAAPAPGLKFVVFGAVLWIRIRNSRVPDPGPYPEMVVNIGKNYQKKH